MTPETTPPHGPVTLRELTADLLWPRLFRAVAMGFRPACVGLAFLMVVAVMAVGEAFDAAHGLVADVETPIFGGFLAATPLGPPGQFVELMAPHPVGAGILALVQLPIVCLFGVAICRLHVTDAGMSLRLTAAEGLGFALPRLGSALAAFLIPVALAGALALLAWLVGLLGAIPVVDVIGAALFGIVLLLSALAVLIVVVLGLGAPLLLPAIAAESADAFDAIQRAYAYVLGRTVRFVLYSLLAGLLLGITALAVGWLGFATWMVTDIISTQTSEASPSSGVAESIRAIWGSAFNALVGAIVASVYFSLTSTLFLLCRRVNDEQDISDVWMPTDPNGARASARAGAGA